MRFIFFFLLFLSCRCVAQWKDYTIGVKGDTLNKTDLKDQKQGKWVVHLEELRGEPGYDEEGVYVNNRKEGPWRRYSLQGDLIALENYRWGYKDGISQYFNGLGELQREESWKAIDPEKKFDTLDVEDVDKPGTFRHVIVKNEGASIKHGSWKFYDPSRGTIEKTEEYVGGILQNPSANTASVSSETKKVDKPKEVLEFEKKNAGKKHIKVRDGSTL